MCGTYTELREALRESPLIRAIVVCLILFAWVVFGSLLMLVIMGEQQIPTLAITGIVGLFFFASLYMLVAVIHEACRRQPSAGLPVLPSSPGATAPRGVLEGETFEATNPLRASA